jgi:hypothetical protein
MKSLFFEGGPLFMGILTVILIILVAWSLYHFLPVLVKKEIDISKTASSLKNIKTIGTFGLVTGFLGQLIGLYQVFDLVEREGDIPTFLWLGGLKVTMITSMYGALIFLFSMLLWFVFDYIATKKSE